MKKALERIGIATVAAAIGYGASELPRKATEIPRTPEDGSWSNIPAVVEDIRLKARINGQEVEVKVDGTPVYRSLPKSE